MQRRGLVALGGGLVAIAVLGAVALVLLSDGAAAPDPTTTTEPTTTTTTTAAVPVAPLTGLPADAPEVLERVALVVKIDNAEGLSRPQAGLGEADVVYEEMVEGQASRFAAVFQSSGAELVGPVRSGRATDIAIVSPLGRPLYAFSGANEITIRELRAAPLVDIGFDVAPDAYERVADRPAPDNLFSSTPVLWGLAPEDAGPPDPLFGYREPGEALGGEAVAGVEYRFGEGTGAPAVRYEWDPSTGRWLRWQGGTPHLDDADGHLGAENLVIQFVAYRDTGLVDAAGTPVPEAELLGEGDVWVLSGGERLAGRWSRDSSEQPTVLTDGPGAPIQLTPGRTWVVLLPVGAPAEVTACSDAPDDPGCASR